MANPLLDKLKSIMMFEEVGGTAPTLATPKQIAVDNSSINTIGAVDFAATANSDHIGRVLEALDGNVKGQMVLIKGMVASTNVATTSNFAAAPSGLTQMRVWNFNIPMATPSSDGSNTNIISTLRTESNDYWNQYKLLQLAGANPGVLTTISDFAAAGDNFAVPAMTNSSLIGDCIIPVQCVQPSEVTVAIGFGAPLERQVVTDTLAQEGIIVGAIADSSVSMSCEIRPLATAASAANTAVAPAELHCALGQIFTEVLDTGNAVCNTSSATSVVIGGTTSPIAKYSLVLINGEVAAVSNVANATPAAAQSTLTIPAGHLTAAPVTPDVVYAGACYKPVDTGHKSVGFIGFLGNNEMFVLAGGMPSLEVDIQGDKIAQYKFNYSMAGGFIGTAVKSHNDVYDTTAPLVGRSNYNRVVLGGTALDADVLSLSGQLLPAPSKRNCAFGAFENNGGHFYTVRNPQLTMQVYFPSSAKIHAYRAMQTFDLLIQVGSSPAGAWGLWAPRAQLIEAPGLGASDELMTQTLTFRFLRPTTGGQPDFVLAHF